MKTKKFLGCLAALAMTLHASAQVAWDTNGNTVAGADWFGADAGSTIPLRIRNDANQPIEWYTNFKPLQGLLRNEGTLQSGTFSFPIKRIHDIRKIFTSSWFRPTTVLSSPR